MSVSKSQKSRNERGMTLIYLATCQENNKRYFGKTVYSLKKREMDHRSAARTSNRNYVFYKALNKHKEKIVFEEFFWAFTHADALRAEIELIAQFQTSNRDFGYNMTAGGEGALGRVTSEELRQKLSAALSGKTPSEETRRKLSQAGKGRVFSEEHRRKIGDAHRGEKNKNWGKSLPQEVIKKMVEGRLKNSTWVAKTRRALSDERKKLMEEGKKRARAEDPNFNPGCSKPVRWVNSGAIYPSCFAAAKAAGCSLSKVSRCASGRARPRCGNRWEFVDKLEVKK